MKQGPFAKYLMLTVYSYLSTSELLNVRYISKRTKEILIDSGILSAGRTFEIKFLNDTPCLLHGNLLKLKLNQRKAIFELVSEVKLDLSAVNGNFNLPCSHKLEERLAEFVTQLPPKFFEKKISIVNPA